MTIFNRFQSKENVWMLRHNASSSCAHKHAEKLTLSGVTSRCLTIKKVDCQLKIVSGLRHPKIISEVTNKIIWSFPSVKTFYLLPLHIICLGMRLRGYNTLHVSCPTKFGGNKGTWGFQQPLSNFSFHDLDKKSSQHTLGLCFIVLVNPQPIDKPQMPCLQNTFLASYLLSERRANSKVNQAKGFPVLSGHASGSRQTWGIEHVGGKIYTHANNLLPVRIMRFLMCIRYCQALHVACPPKHACN